MRETEQNEHPLNIIAFSIMVLYTSSFPVYSICAVCELNKESVSGKNLYTVLFMGLVGETTTSRNTEYCI
jgi:hypothetical protein